jgi:hypothetical protein
MEISCTARSRWAHPAKLALVLFSGMAFALGTARAESASPQSTARTVSWYAANEQARAQMQLKCIDDPGHLMNTPDCINAQQAGVEAAYRKMKGRFPPKDPSKTDFWSADPNNRKSQLLMCRGNPQLQYCDVARRSLLEEAGKR